MSRDHDRDVIEAVFGPPMTDDEIEAMFGLDRVTLEDLSESAQEWVGKIDAGTTVMCCMRCGERAPVALSGRRFSFECDCGWEIAGTVPRKP